MLGPEAGRPQDKVHVWAIEARETPGSEQITVFVQALASPQPSVTRKVTHPGLALWWAELLCADIVRSDTRRRR